MRRRERCTTHHYSASPQAGRETPPATAHQPPSSHSYIHQILSPPNIHWYLTSFSRIFEMSAVWVKKPQLKRPKFTANYQHFECTSNMWSHCLCFTHKVQNAQLSEVEQCKVGCRGNQNVGKLMFQVTALESHWSQPKGNSYQYFHMPTAPPLWRNKAFP